MNRPIRILWQSSTNIERYPAYAKAIKARANAILSPGNLLDVRGVPYGTGLLHFRAFDFLNNTEVFNSVVRAEHDGYDAVAIGCFLDPVLHEVREIMDIPVFSLAEAGMHVACMYGQRFSVLNYSAPNNVKFVAELIERYGLEKRAAPSVAFALSFEQLEQAMAGNPRECLDLVRAAARRAIAGGAEVILLGCGLLNLVCMQNGLHEVDGAPILDVSGVLMKLTESMVAIRRLTGLRPSRVGLYEKPSDAEINEVLAIYGRNFRKTEAEKPR